MNSINKQNQTSWEIIRKIEDSPFIAAINLPDIIDEYFEMYEPYREDLWRSPILWRDPMEEYEDAKENAYKYAWKETQHILKDVNDKYKELYGNDYEFKVYKIDHRDNENHITIDHTIGIESDVPLFVEHIVDEYGYDVLLDFNHAGFIVSILSNNKKNIDIQYIVEITHPYDEHI